MIEKLKYAAKSLLAPIIFKFPPTDIQPQRLMFFLNAIVDTASIPGPIVEVGSHLCGTSIVAYRTMRNLGIDKPYICVDTFSGFVPEQFDADLSKGTPEKDRLMFAANSEHLVSRILKIHGCTDIQLLKRDCTKITGADFPNGISLCLLDVDLSEPIHKGLQRLWPLINPGGRILVDDCPENTSWKALHGFRAFCDEIGAPLVTKYGMGVIEKAASVADRVKVSALLA
jgi:hypothetical protein